MSVNRRREEDNSLQLGYVQITPKTAPILLKILELESEAATITMVANALGEDRNVVYDFIKEAERDSRQFLICND